MKGRVKLNSAQEKVILEKPILIKADDFVSKGQIKYFTKNYFKDNLLRDDSEVYSDSVYRLR